MRSPPGGKPAPKGDAGRSGPARAGVLRAPARRRRPDPAGQLRHQRTPRLAAARHRSPKPTSWPSPRPSATTGARQGTDGPLYMGKDTHALSGPAQRTALEVLAANGVETIIQRDDGVTPTPVISRAILVYNRGRTEHLADGIVITPSHNPPEDGGFKYNPTNGGPADTDVTRVGRGPGQRAAARAATPA